MHKSLISDVLKTLMFKKDIKTAQLARDTQLPQQTLQRIVSGSSPNPQRKTLDPLAEFFNVSIEQLKGEEPLPEAIVDTNLPIAKPQIKHAPLIPWDEVEQYIESPAQFETTNCEQILIEARLSDTAFAITMNDTSMEPYFPQGSTLILDPEKPIRDRCHALVKVIESNILVFRQILIDGEYRYLKPMNPDLNAFPMRLLNREDQILGVLVEFRHRYSEF